jgi:chromosome segregation ATPase
MMQKMKKCLVLVGVMCLAGSSYANAMQGGAAASSSGGQPSAVAAKQAELQGQIDTAARGFNGFADRIGVLAAAKTKAEQETQEERNRAEKLEADKKAAEVRATEAEKKLAEEKQRADNLQTELDSLALSLQQITDQSTAIGNALTAAGA